MSRITIDGQAQGLFDDEELHASYRAEFTPDGGVAVHVEVRRGDLLLGTIAVARFEASQVTGFSEES